MNYLGKNYITKCDIYTRDGLIRKGTKCYIDEFSESEYDLDGNNTPYRIAFDVDKVLNEVGGLASEWFSLNDLENLFELQDDTQEMENRLSEQKLQLILTIQDYAKFQKNNAKLLGIDISTFDWIDVTEQYYNNLPDDILAKEGLKKNKRDFEKVYYYKVTDEIMKSPVEELNSFKF